MRSLLRWMLRNPRAASILVGLVVATVLGWASFPREGTIERSVEDWLPQNLASGVAERAGLAGALAAYRAGEDVAAEVVSFDSFGELGLQQTHAELLVSEDERDFVIQYAGREAAGGPILYVAERKIAASSWWSPDRWAYRALKAEADQLGAVLRLTFERDTSGLLVLLVMDAIIGAFYGGIVALILNVLGLEGLDRKQATKLLPKSAPLTPIGGRGAPGA